MKNFKKFLATSLLVMISSSALAQLTTQKSVPKTAPPEASATGGSTVYVPGTVDCSDGHYSDACGWPSGPIYESGGGSSGGGGSVGGGSSGAWFNNDGTTGTVLDKNRFYEGCVLEQAFKNQVLQAVVDKGGPVGTRLALDLGDPLYRGGDWDKYEMETIRHEEGTQQGTFIQKRIRIHYMYNYKTGWVEQFKFKNSYEYGCVGVKVTR